MTPSFGCLADTPPAGGPPLGRNRTSTGLLHVVKSTVVKRSTLTPGGPSVELRPCASGVRVTIQINMRVGMRGHSI
jgi:hypothetical protein